MELLKNITKGVGETISNLQKKFVESNFGRIVKEVMNVGIRIALPDFSENMVVDVADSLYENGLKDGVKKIWSNIKSYGKSFLGVSTGKFDNIEQIQKATKTGGILDTISSAFDFALEKAVDNNKITRKTRQSIKTQKNEMIKKMKKEIIEEVDNQAVNVKKINEYTEKWQKAFDNKDLKGMKNANKNLKKYLENTIPLENLLTESKKIDIIQNLVENTGSFDVTNEEKELALALAN